jgi:hypothetical protein
MYDRPGWAWWDGTDPLYGQWIQVHIQSFLKDRGIEAPASLQVYSWDAENAATLEPSLS